MGRTYKRLPPESIREMQRLAQEGLSLEKIALALDSGKSTIYYHAKPYCRKQTGLKLDILTMKEKGYLMGMFVGDGNIILKPKKGQYGIKITLDKTNDQDIAEYFHTLMDKAGKKIQRQIERNSLVLRIFSKKLVEFILNYISIKRQFNSRRNIKSLINCQNWNADFKIGFVGGLIDSDGYVFHRKNRKHYGAIVKTNDQLLGKQIHSILQDLGLNTYIRAHEFNGTYQTTALCYDVYIPSKEMLKLCREMISVKHARYH